MERLPVVANDDDCTTTGRGIGPGHHDQHVRADDEHEHVNDERVNDQYVNDQYVNDEHEYSDDSAASGDDQFVEPHPLLDGRRA